MGVADTKEKIIFLENILKIAKENPGIITENGRGIFYEDYPAFDESCIVGLHLDEKGKPYFKIKGTVEATKDKVYTPKELLIVGKRYLTKHNEEFKNSFHLYETRDGGKDLLDKIR